MKLTDAESTEVTVREPWVRADSIGGVTEDSGDWSVPLSSVAEVKTKRFNVLLTSGVVLGGLMVVAGGLVIYCLIEGTCLEG